MVLVFNFLQSSDCISFIRELFSFYGAGPSVVHKTAEWPFDPEVGVRRSRQYRRVYGEHGEKYIERLGLGFDGKEQERLIAQRTRDEKLFEIIRRS